jgi:transposase
MRGRTKMSRTGNCATRSALYMPAVVASRHNPVLRVFAERLHANGLPKKAVIGAVMRKLVHLSTLLSNPELHSCRITLINYACKESQALSRWP